MVTLLVHIQFEGSTVNTQRAERTLRMAIEASKSELAENIGALLFTICADSEIAELLPDAIIQIKYK